MASDQNKVAFLQLTDEIVQMGCKAIPPEQSQEKRDGALPNCAKAVAL
jgi:hypothetical protein